MTHSNLVANELKSAGFRTRVITSNAVEVSLTSRKISTLEVSYATDQIFSEVQFNFTATNNANVIISW